MKENEDKIPFLRWIYIVTYLNFFAVVIFGVDWRESFKLILRRQ